MTKLLTESLSYMDMKDHVTPILGIDEFDSQIGENSDIITLNFIVDGESVGNDLVDWLERGYEWIIDSDISPGEVLDKKFYVFAELNRSSTAPKRIIELIDDLETLTGLKEKDWSVKINGKRIPASEDNIKKHIILKPQEYKERLEKDLNEWREIAGIPQKKSIVKDEEILQWQRQAGII